MKRLLLIISISILFSSCNTSDSENQEVTDSENSEVPSDKTIQERYWRLYNEPVSLLSSKYNISDSLGKNIVIEYFKIHSPLQYNGLTIDSKDYDSTIKNSWSYPFIPSEAVDSTISRISYQFSVEKSKIASFLFDLRIYKKLDDIDDNIYMNSEDINSLNKSVKFYHDDF